MLKIKKILILLLIIFNITALLLPAIAATPAGDKIKKGLIETGNAAGLQTEKTPVEILGTYVNAVLNIMGVLFLILMIYGGFVWMTAAGNEEKIGKAKKIIISAAIGIAIIILAKAITLAILYALRPAVETATPGLLNRSSS